MKRVIFRKQLLLKERSANLNKTILRREFRCHFEWMAELFPLPRAYITCLLMEKQTNNKFSAFLHYVSFIPKKH